MLWYAASRTCIKPPFHRAYLMYWYNESLGLIVYEGKLDEIVVMIMEQIYETTSDFKTSVFSPLTSAEACEKSSRWLWKEKLC